MLCSNVAKTEELQTRTATKSGNLIEKKNIERPTSNIEWEKMDNELGTWAEHGRLQYFN